MAKGLVTARTIAGQSFDGTANITISLGNLSNVDTTGLANNKILKYNSTSGNWEIADDAGGGSGIALTDLSVGSEPSASGNGALAYNNSSGVFTYTPPLNISGTAAIATTVTITDNESTNENNAIVFTAGGDVDGGNLGLESDGTLTYNPSTGKITATGFVGTLTGDVTGDVTGNADTATALATARTIGGVSFDGTGNINLPGVNTGGNQNTTGSAATLTTARTIGGVSFDGSGNINLPGVNTAGNQDTTGNAATATALETARTIHGVSFDGTGNIDLTEVIEDTVGAMFSSNTETNITATYQDSDGTIDLVIGTLNQDTTGNAATATALETARTIGGVSFDGTGNINLPGVNTSGNQDTTGNAATATALETARTIHGVSFDGSANIDLTEVIEDTVGTMVSSNTETGITVAYQDGDGTLDFSLSAAQTTITSLLATDIKIGEDDQTKIDFETADEIHFYAANAHQVKIVDGAIVPATDNDVDLGTSSLEFKDAYFDGTVTADTFAGGFGVTGSSTAAGSILFKEATNNGGASITLIGVASVGSGYTVTLPSSAGTLALQNEDTTGNAATATALATARTIGGTRLR